jgi:hypothetical protein
MVAVPVKRSSVVVVTPLLICSLLKLQDGMFGEVDEGAVFEFNDGAAVLRDDALAFLKSEALGCLQPLSVEIRFAIFPGGRISLRHERS